MNHMHNAPLTRGTAISQHYEEQLVTGLQSGDAACFEQLVRDYGGRMLSVALRYLLNEDDAQDCVSGSFVHFLMSARKLSHSKFSAVREGWFDSIDTTYTYHAREYNEL